MTTLKDNKHTRNRVILLSLGLLFLGYCLLTILPWQPRAYGFDLDESWASAVHIAFREQMQFGKDLIYTYGPYGFLRVANYYFPETYGYAFTFCVLIAIAVWAGLFRIVRYCLRRRDRSVIFLIPILWFFPNAHLSMDSFQFTIVILPFILYFYVSKRLTPALVLTLINVALSSLIKHTYLLLAIALIALITIDELAKLKRIPQIAPIYLAMVWIFWLLAAQDIANIPAYIINGLEIIRGFSASMGTPGNLDEVLLYCFGVGIFLVLVALIEWKTRRWWGILPTLGLAAMFFLIFKGAFVRHDTHALQTVFNATPIMLIFTAVLWSPIKETSGKIGKRIKLSLFLLLGTSAVSIIVMSSIIFNHYLDNNYGTYILQATNHTIQTLPQVLRVITGKGNFQAIADQGKAAIRAANILPPISGTVDLYPNEIATLFSYDLEYQPRPIFQSFSAYTSKLARLNAEHLTQPNAAKNLLVDLKPIDGHLASFEDGLSWLEMLTRYDLANIESGYRYLLLHRNAQPRQYQLTSMMDQVDIGLNDWFEVTDSQQPIWSKIKIQPNLLGKLTSAILRLPPLEMEIETVDGVVNKYRTIADVMREGFLISPVLSNRWDWLDFATPDWQTKLSSKQVKRFRITAEGFNAMLYPQKYQVNLSQLDFPRQSLEKVMGWQNWNGQIVPRPLEGSVQRIDIDDKNKIGLLAHAPAKLEVRLPGTKSSFAFNFGILEQAVENGLKENRGDGVEFKIIAVQADGKQEIVFARKLQPIDRAEDRGTHHGSIDLTNFNGEKLILSTLQGKDNSYDWSYWSELKFE
jgi:hypothetical protein